MYYHNFIIFLNLTEALPTESAFNPSGLQACPMNLRMFSLPYVELENKHEGRFIGILPHMAGLMIPLNYEELVV